MQSLDYSELLDTYVKGKTLNKEKLSILPILLPPLEEQRKIVKVLDKIQQAIELQDRIIEQTKNFKKSLMQKLFREGLYGEEQKYTEIGLIPEDWEVVSAKEICLKVTDGTHDTPKPTKEGYYLITSKHLKDNKIDFSDAYFISKEDYNRINNRSKVDVGDVLFSMIGTIGTTVVVERNYPFFAIKNVGLFKTGGNFTLAYWLHYYFQSLNAKKYIQNSLKGATQKYIPLYALREFPIPFPPLEEQKQIVHILNVVDKKIEIEQKRKQVLKKLFKTMLHKLMSGKIRLKDVEI